MPEKLTEKRWLSFELIFMFVLVVFFQAACGLYAVYGLVPPQAFVFFGYLGFFWLISQWFTKDSKSRNLDWVFDMGFFLYVFWPFFIPYYLFKTRGFIKAMVISLCAAALFVGVFVLSCALFYLLAHSGMTV